VQLKTASGNARVNDTCICDPVQGSLVFGELTPVIFHDELKKRIKQETERSQALSADK